MCSGAAIHFDSEPFQLFKLVLSKLKRTEYGTIIRAESSNVNKKKLATELYFVLCENVYNIWVCVCVCVCKWFVDIFSWTMRNGISCNNNNYIKWEIFCGAHTHDPAILFRFVLVRWVCLEYYNNKIRKNCHIHDFAEKTFCVFVCGMQKFRLRIYDSKYNLVTFNKKKKTQKKSLQSDLTKYKRKKTNIITEIFLF